MKKLLMAVLLIGFSSSSFASSFTCYRYVNGHPTGGWISVTADSKSEAESIAYNRFKELGGAVDYAKCNY